jgi:hypothetical protein
MPYWCEAIQNDDSQWKISYLQQKNTVSLKSMSNAEICKNYT